MKQPRYEPRYKFVRMEKNFGPGAFKLEVEQLSFTTIYAMGTPEGKLDMFNSLFLSFLERLCPLIRRNLTRPPAPWLKELDIEKKLQQRYRLKQTDLE